MAIKIQGTTIIDDTANVSNICIINATTVCATANLYGSGSNLTNLPPAPVYACGIACSSITAGDPVSLTCCNCGLVPTLSSMPSYVMACTQNCGASSCSTPSVDVSTLRFCCSDCCFASIEFWGGGNYASGSCYDRCICTIVRAHCISSTGGVSSCIIYSCVLPSTCPCWNPSGKIISVPGCSGSTGAFLIPINCTCLQEVFLCYCTTSNTISVLRNCCGAMWAGSGCIIPNWPHVTPDGKYLVAFYYCSPGINTCVASGTYACASVCYGAYVKATTDNVCYLGVSGANSCNSTLKSVLPACPFMGGPTGMNTTAKGGYNPFSYGVDGWLLMHHDVSAPGGGCCCACAGFCYCACLAAVTYGFKPVGDGCYSITNTICSGSGQIHCDCLGGNNLYGTQYVTDMGMIWDRGDNVKRQLVATWTASAIRTQYAEASNYWIQCYCVSGTCMCYKGCTCFSPPPNPCCASVCIPANNFLPIPGQAFCGFSGPYGYVGQNYADGVNNPSWNGACVCCANWFKGGITVHLNRLYLTAMPLCYQCSCFYVAAPAEAAVGCENCITTCSVLTYCYFYYCNCIGVTNTGFGCYPQNATCPTSFGTTIKFDGSCFNLTCSNCNFYYDGSNVNIITANSSATYLTGYHPASHVFNVDCGNYLPPASAFPVFMRGGQYLVAMGAPQSLGCVVCTWGNPCGNWIQTGCCSAQNIRLSVATCGTIASNYNKWIGIAQNSAAPGGTVCYATPGMIDASPFSCCVCALTTTSIVAGLNPWHCICSPLQGPYIYGNAYCFYNCFYCNCFYNYCVCPVTSCPGINLIGGIPYGNCVYYNCYYFNNIQFTPIYDQGLQKWTTKIDQRHSQGWIPCNCGGAICNNYYSWLY